MIRTAMSTHPPAQYAPRRDVALAVSVGFLLFAVFVLCYRGGFHSIDEVSMFAVTESLVKIGRPDTDQIAWTQWTTSQREAQGFFGIDGHVYSKKGLAMSLAMVPLYWVGLVIPGLGMLQTASLINQMVTAVTGALLYLTVRRLGYRERVALGVALLYGLATIAWVYSKYLFSEPLAGLLLLATAYLLVASRQQGGLWRVVLAGFLVGLAVVTRANNLFLVPVFGAYMIAVSRPWSAVSSQRSAVSSQRSAVSSQRSAVSGQRSAVSSQQSAGQQPNGSPAPPWPAGASRDGLPPRSPLARWREPGRAALLLPALCFLLGLVPPALLLVGYNWARSGNPLQTGYDLTIFSPAVWWGLYKLLFSPLRGLFVYSPLLLLSLPGLWWLWRRHRLEAALVVGSAGLTVLLFAAWTSGEGLSWGSRFLIPVVPLLCLPLAPVVERAMRGSLVTGGLLIGLGLLSAVIQFLGVAINPWIYLGQLQADFGGEFFLEKTAAITDFRYAQIIGQIGNWSLANSDVAWWQPWGLDAVALGLCLFLILVAIVNLRWQSRRSPSIISLIIPLILVLPITYVLLTRYYHSDRQFGLPDDAYTGALYSAVAQGSPGDGMVTVAPYHYHVAMNRFKARVPIVGFSRQVPPLPETALPLLADTGRGENVWMVTSGFPPAAPDNAVERWLALNAFKASDWWLDDVRLVGYATGKGQPVTTRVVNARLGEELALTAVSMSESAQAGQSLAVEFSWLALKRPSADYNVFLQLLTGDGLPAAQYDSPPNGGYTPTSAWSAGQEVADRHGLILPSDLPAGDYRLITGLVNPVTGQRLPVSSGGDFVELAEVTVR